MVIGVLQFELPIPQASSLKDKRRVVRSLKDRLHREHLVAVAEIGSQDVLNVAVMGVASLSADGRQVGKTLDAIDAKLRAQRDAEVGRVTRAMINSEAIETSPTLADTDELRREMLSHMNEGPDQ
ncbi:MAG: DUF503 domain-containing protein [Phycisphaerales bacterium]|nr:DUF503 domain-containing protein [Phycisphaerales bacterium]